MTSPNAKQSTRDDESDKEHPAEPQFALSVNENIDGHVSRFKGREVFQLWCRRRQEDIDSAEQEFEELIWLHDYKLYVQRVERGELTLSDEMKRRLEFIKEHVGRLEEKYGKDQFGRTDFELGLLKGRMSALRWINGKDWRVAS